MTYSICAVVIVTNFKKEKKRNLKKIYNTNGVKIVIDILFFF